MSDNTCGECTTCAVRARSKHEFSSLDPKIQHGRFDMSTISRRRAIIYYLHLLQWVVDKSSSGHVACCTGGHLYTDPVCTNGQSTNGVCNVRKRGCYSCASPLHTWIVHWTVFALSALHAPRSCIIYYKCASPTESQVFTCKCQTWCRYMIQ